MARRRFSIYESDAEEEARGGPTGGDGGPFDDDARDRNPEAGLDSEQDSDVLLMQTDPVADPVDEPEVEEADEGEPGQSEADIDAEIAERIRLAAHTAAQRAEERAIDEILALEEDLERARSEAAGELESIEGRLSEIEGRATDAERRAEDAERHAADAEEELEREREEAAAEARASERETRDEEVAALTADADAAREQAVAEAVAEAERRANGALEQQAERLREETEARIVREVATARASVEQEAKETLRAREEELVRKQAAIEGELGVTRRQLDEANARTAEAERRAQEIEAEAREELARERDGEPGDSEAGAGPEAEAAEDWVAPKPEAEAIAEGPPEQPAPRRGLFRRPRGRDADAPLADSIDERPADEAVPEEPEKSEAQTLDDASASLAELAAEAEKLAPGPPTAEVEDEDLQAPSWVIEDPAAEAGPLPEAERAEPAAEAEPEAETDEPEPENEPEPEPEPQPEAAAPEATAEDEEPEFAAEATNGNRPESGVPDGLVSLSRADFDTLRGLGMSVTQAKRVIRYRDERGGFRSVDDLDRVPGFPRNFLEGVKDRLVP